MNQSMKTIPVGGELGTSSSKFCMGNTVVIFPSVVGGALSTSMAKSWRLMNRSPDQRWIKNLAIFDDERQSWRYVGAITRISDKLNWFTQRGLIQNFDDAFLALKAGIFLLHEEHKTAENYMKIGLGFGVTVRHGENVLEKFLDYLKTHLIQDGDRKYLVIRGNNVATDEQREVQVDFSFFVMQYQAYGAYMAILFSKFKMELYNTYVIDIGHGTWIKLPIIENEADLNLCDSITEGMFTITKNVSSVIFESSGQRFRIPEQKIMEKLPLKNYKIEVPGTGVYDFEKLLHAEARQMGKRIVERVISDLTILSEKGQTIDYFTIIGGGAHLLRDTIKGELANFFGWKDEERDERVIDPFSLNVDPRHINCVGFMLLARDQIALEMGEDVDGTFEIVNIIQDKLASDQPDDVVAEKNSGNAI